MKFDEQLIVPNEELSIMQGAITAPGYNSVNARGSMSKVLFDALAAKYGFSLETPFKDLPRKIKDIIFYGAKEKLRITYSNVRGTGTYDYAFEVVINTLRRRYNETSEAVRAEF